MPTSENAPSARVLEIILHDVIKHIGETGWSEAAITNAKADLQLTNDEISLACSNGVSSLVQGYMSSSVDRLAATLSKSDLASMRIREKVTFGVESWFEVLSEHHLASVKALDWCRARPFGPLPMTEFIWSVADVIWTGIGDDAGGFTYASKRTTLSAVLASTLTVWRQSEDEEVWKGFLERRIENVMTFEKAKAKIKIPMPF